VAKHKCEGLRFCIASSLHTLVGCIGVLVFLLNLSVNEKAYEKMKKRLASPSHVISSSQRLKPRQWRLNCSGNDYGEVAKQAAVAPFMQNYVHPY
jgi:hypothetical protein